MSLEQTPPERQTTKYKRLIEISLDLASTLDLDTLLIRIVGVACELSESEQSSILLYDETTQQLFFQTSTSIATHPDLRGMVVPVENSLAGWVVKHRQPVMVTNVKEDIRHFGVIDQSIQFSTHSLIGIPLVTQDKILGVLEVINKINGEYTQDDLQILTGLGAQAAVAIQNTRLFQQSDHISELVHELRSPLSSMWTAAHLLQRSNIPEEQRIELAGIIFNEARWLNEMTSLYLDPARLESGRAGFKLSFFDVSPLINECCRMMQGLAAENQVTINQLITPELPAIQADRDKTKQVLLNLLNNAIKYNRRNGEITLLAASDGTEMVITVRDTGIGIPSAAMPHLFEKFFRVIGSEKIASGTGLGLTFCWQIVQAQRGHIEVNSQVDKGTEFIIHLPLRQG